jgi:hypothetical protein
MHINADALLLGSSNLSNDHSISYILFFLSSLQIFENESHASVHSDRTKEGLSLYGIYIAFRASHVL